MTMMSDATVITNLLYRYAEHVDAGEFDKLADLFRHARIGVRAGDDGWIDGPEIATYFEANIIRYADGTPRTKHIVTNPIIEFDRVDAARRLGQLEEVGRRD